MEQSAKEPIINRNGHGQSVEVGGGGGRKKKKKRPKAEAKKKKNERGGGVVVNQIQILKSLAGFSFGAPSSPPSCPSTVLTRAQTSPTPCKQGQI